MKFINPWRLQKYWVFVCISVGINVFVVVQVAYNYPKQNNNKRILFLANNNKILL